MQKLWVGYFFSTKNEFTTVLTVRKDDLGSHTCNIFYTIDFTLTKSPVTLKRFGTI